MDNYDFVKRVEARISSVICKLDNIDSIMDMIYDHIDSKLLEGDFDGVNWILSEVDMSLIPTVLHLSFLTITLAAKSKLSNRKRFYDKAFHRTRCIEGKEKADRLFSGLE